MKLKVFLILYFLHSTAVYCKQQQRSASESLRVQELNAYADQIRSTDPKKTIASAKEALTLAQKINDELGMAEAYRVMGTGYALLAEDDIAISKFLLALNLFKKHKNSYGEAMVYSNLGNRYKNYDRKEALKYYLKCLAIAKKGRFEELVAGSSINIANVLIKNEKYNPALSYLNQSYEYFSKDKDTASISMILLSKGFLFLKVGNYRESKKYLLQCKEICKQKQYSSRLLSVNLHLSNVYTASREFTFAQTVIEEGFVLARAMKLTKFELDFLKQHYYLEKAKGNPDKAISFLEQVYRLDSIQIRELVSKKFTLHREQFDFIEKQKQTEILLEKQKTNRVITISAIIVSILACAVIALLIIHSRKKAKTLQKMRELNEEISVQKENLNFVNQNLEKTIAERTQDLEIKNLKLSQYSSYLSHEIRGPVSTIKGLMILDDEDLIDDQELISEVRRCVEEIDFKLLNINHMLHNPKYKAFVLPENQNGGTTIPPSSPEEN